MSDDLINKALAIKTALESEINQVRPQLSRMQKFLDVLQGQLDSAVRLLEALGVATDVETATPVEKPAVRVRHRPVPLSAANPPRSNSTGQQSSSPTEEFVGPPGPISKSAVASAVEARRSNSSKEDVAAKTREIIEIVGEPVAREDLLATLRDEGLTIEGNPPETVLSTMLWRMAKAAKIVHIKGRGYWLADREYEPAGYYPPLTPEIVRQLTRNSAPERGNPFSDDLPPSADGDVFK